MTRRLLVSCGLLTILVQAPVSAQAGASFYTLPPCRVFDTRSAPNGAFAGPALQPGAARTFPITSSSCGVPDNATALSINLTVTQPQALGVLTVYAVTPPAPLTTSIAFRGGQTRANNSIVQLAADGGLRVLNSSAGTVHCIVDVNGYFAPSGSPIQITRGGTYSGAWQSLDPAMPAVTVTTGEPVVLTRCRIISAGDGIQSYNYSANVTVKNCTGQGLNPNVVGKTKGFFVVLSNFSSLVVEHNLIENFFNAGYGVNYPPAAADTLTGQTVLFRYNLVHNADGRQSDGHGGYLAETSIVGGASAFHTYYVRNANVEIAWNEIVNEPYRSEPGDIISTAESSGLPSNPMNIHDNFLQGDNPADIATFLTFSGCGIQLGDSPSKGNVGYVHAHDNQIVNFASCGLSISSGHDNEVDHNRVISARTLPDGTPTNNQFKVGIQMNSYYWDPNYTNQPIADPYWYANSMHDNAVNAAFNDGVTYNIYFHLGPTVIQFNNFDPLGHIATTADEQAEYASWRQKLIANGITLGPQ